MGEDDPTDAKERAWIWKRDSETYDVFIGREMKTNSGSVRFSIQAKSGYPDYRIELPSGKRYGFARVHKSGGEWTINGDYQVNLERAPIEITSLSGPTLLNSGEQGTWTASVSGGEGSTSYDWEYRPAGSYSWYDKSCTGSSCSHTFYGDGDTGGIRVTVTKGSESDQATANVYVSLSCDGRICVKSQTEMIAVRGPEVDPQTDRTARLRWDATGPLPAGRFAVEHRRDSTAAWSRIGTVAVADSMEADTTVGPAYRFGTDPLPVGPHQFRLALRAAEKSVSGTTEWTTEAVTARIEMEDDYRLSTYPNPIRDRATVELAVKEAQPVTVAIYDVLGRRVATLLDGPLPAQELRRLRLDATATGLTSGTYFLRVTGEEFAATEQMTVVR